MHVCGQSTIKGKAIILMVFASNGCSVSLPVQTSKKQSGTPHRYSSIGSALQSRAAVANHSELHRGITDGFRPEGSEVNIAVNLCYDCICSLGYEVPWHEPLDINCRCYWQLRSEIPDSFTDAFTVLFVPGHISRSKSTLYSPRYLVCTRYNTADSLVSDSDSLGSSLQRPFISS
ncbi:hypothetical protein KQX54_007503 [Cotesia glomerata]|uniref:Uncharacterized protein n=1 Tax=Cotesia glomerata TaxID=32391 RepID=A0AAV7I5Z5_COTGL|nr:hypothetical protein KQX54_007503 [Cotesia glomerata]